ncbi:MAG: spore cortex-lytic enzyme [Clostridia bacterium]|nr:spore cortex-lytic enzyme [Clostridia bacterium]
MFKEDIFVSTTKKVKLTAFVLAFVTIVTVAFAVALPKADAAVIKVGSRGQTVRTIQTKLKRWGYYKGSVDGIFGSQTKSAVQYFQRKNGLTADGIVGKATAKALGISLSGTTSGSTSAGNISNSDLYLLSCCVYGEARGESYTGKVAVAAVVLNRVKNSQFPNTISGVIYQRGAFTCVADGQINLGTNDECTRAAQDALNGWDPSGGALYYFNPKTATSAWIWSRPQLVTIGRHIFCA